MSAEASMQPVLEPALHAELARLRQENHRLAEELASAEASIALHSKALDILGALTDERPLDS